MKRIINHITLFSLLFSGCSVTSQPEKQITPPVVAIETPSANTVVSPSQADDGVIQATPTMPLSYEFLSSAIVRNRPGTMTFEVSATLTQSTFQFRVDALVPPEFEFSYPDYIYPNIYKSVELSFSPPLEIEQIGGGGGSGAVDGKFTLDSEMDYRILNLVTLGQIFHLKAVILFNEFTAITEPVPFEIILTVN